MHLDAPTHPVDAPCWLDLASPDVKRAAAFYGELFGWSYRVDGPEYGNYHTALLEAGAVAGIGQLQEGAPMPSAWTVYLHTHDVAAAVTSVTEAGAQVMAGPMEVPFQGHLAIVQDPQGAVFGLWQPTGHTGFGTRNVAGAYGWAEVNVRDVDAAVAFYTAITGATSRPLVDPALPGRYELLTVGEASAFGVMELTASLRDLPAHWLPYFEVAACDEASQRAISAGGTVATPPFTTPFGRIAVLQDPFGATFCVNETHR